MEQADLGVMVAVVEMVGKVAMEPVGGRVEMAEGELFFSHGECCL